MEKLLFVLTDALSISNNELAEMMECSIQQISNFKNGKNKLNVEKVKKLLEHKKFKKLNIEGSRLPAEFFLEDATEITRLIALMLGGKLTLYSAVDAFHLEFFNTMKSQVEQELKNTTSDDEKILLNKKLETLKNFIALKESRTQWLEVKKVLDNLDDLLNSITADMCSDEWLITNDEGIDVFRKDIFDNDDDLEQVNEIITYALEDKGIDSPSGELVKFLLEKLKTHLYSIEYKPFDISKILDI